MEEREIHHVRSRLRAIEAAACFWGSYEVSDIRVAVNAEHGDIPQANYDVKCSL
jgi:hypothetical protein